MALSETEICNLALARIGAKRLNDLDTDSSVPAIHCRTHYEPTRDALLRSHWWRFASARAELSEDVDAPDFEWDNQFSLPNDFLAMKSVYENRFSDENLSSYALEGKKLLTNEDTCEIRYIKKVTDVTQFDPLFVEVLALQLAIKMVMPLSQDKKMLQLLHQELAMIMPSVKALDRQETNTIGQYELETWNDARYTG